MPMGWSKELTAMARQLKEALGARTAGGDWASHLPWVLLGMRVAPKEDSILS